MSLLILLVCGLLFLGEHVLSRSLAEFTLVCILYILACALKHNTSVHSYALLLYLATQQSFGDSHRQGLLFLCLLAKQFFEPDPHAVRRATILPKPMVAVRLSDAQIRQTLQPHCRQVKIPCSDKNHCPFDLTVPTQFGALQWLNNLNDPTQSTCSVCLQPKGIAHRFILILPCKHTYHVACIINWCKTGRWKCPECRQTIVNG